MDNLRTVRKDIGFTQEEAAKALKISRRSYQNYENMEIKTPEDLNAFYDYLLELLKTYTVIDETHGVYRLEQLFEIVNTVCRKYDFVEAVYLFGSYSRGEATPTSDIDLLVINKPVGMPYFELAGALHEALKKKVDLTTLDQAFGDPEFLKRVLVDGVKIYGQGVITVTNRTRLKAYRISRK